MHTTKEQFVVTITAEVSHVTDNKDKDQSPDSTATLNAKFDVWVIQEGRTKVFYEECLIVLISHRCVFSPDLGQYPCAVFSMQSSPSTVAVPHSVTTVVSVTCKCELEGLTTSSNGRLTGSKGYKLWSGGCTYIPPQHIAKRLEPFHVVSTSKRREVNRKWRYRTPVLFIKARQG